MELFGERQLKGLFWQDFLIDRNPRNTQDWVRSPEVDAVASCKHTLRLSLVTASSWWYLDDLDSWRVPNKNSFETVQEAIISHVAHHKIPGCDTNLGSC